MSNILKYIPLLSLRTIKSYCPGLTIRLYSDDAGSVRKAKGSFAKREAAQEEQYFRKKNAENIQHLKDDLKRGAEDHTAEDNPKSSSQKPKK